MKALIISALVLGSMACACRVSLAAEFGSRPRSQTINFADLDLNHAPGIIRLYSRIRAAAYQVCEPTDPADLGSEQRAHRCVSKSLARAVEAFNVPGLTNIYYALLKRTRVTGGASTLMSE